MGCMENIAQDCTERIGYLGMELRTGKGRELSISEEKKGAEKKKRGKYK